MAISLAERPEIKYGEIYPLDSIVSNPSFIAEPDADNKIRQERIQGRLIARLIGIYQGKMEKNDPRIIKTLSRLSKFGTYNSGRHFSTFVAQLKEHPEETSPFV